MKFRTFAPLAFLLGAVCTEAFAASYQYDTPVTLEGALISSTADPAITYDEKAHQFPALKLGKPISILCAPTDSECQPEIGVTMLHLVLNESQMAEFKRLKGKVAKLRGNLFHADNGHHYTSVLLEVKAITP